MVSSYLRPATQDRVKILKRRGYATIKSLQDPPVTITVWRRGPENVGGWLEVGSYDLISISLTNRDPRESGANQGAVETATVGGFRVWAPIDIQEDDRFDWDIQTCVVLSVQPATSGAHDVQFRLLEGNRS